MPIQASDCRTGMLHFRSRFHSRQAPATQPQIHRSRAVLRGQVIQKGACREKLPSLKRNELARLCATDTTASPTSTTCGRRCFQRRLSVTRKKSGRKMTADSLESSDKANSNTLIRSRPRSQHHSADIPNRNISSSEIAANHITASWWPSWIAKKNPAQAAAVAERRQASTTAKTSQLFTMCKRRLALWCTQGVIPPACHSPNRAQ